MTAADAARRKPPGRVFYALSDDIAEITLADPHTRNALSREMAAEVTGLLRRAEREARVVILTGDGDAFCSGANLFDDAAMGIDGEDAGEVLESHFNPLIRTARDLKIPIVTAIHGPAAGFGVSLALSGDLLIASQSAYFRTAFASVGLIPDGGLTYMLTRTIGRMRALRLLMKNEDLSAEAAFEWGLVSCVVPDAEFAAAVHQAASSLANGPTGIYGAIRRMAWVAMEQNFEQELLLERSLQRSIVRKPNFHEGISAFREKRQPRFVKQ